MKPTALLTVGLTHLTSLAHATSLHTHEIVNLALHDDHSLLPATIIFHPTDGHSGDDNNNSTSSSGNPDYGEPVGNITACNHIAYDRPSPARTRIIRDDCLDLAQQVQRAAGFYELTRWVAVNSSVDREEEDEEEGGVGYRALVRSGTCEFGVQRLGGGVANMSTNSDVVNIGNQDIVRILNASVFDFAGENEYYMDAMRINGHMSCSFWFGVNATMEFLIQYASSGDF